MEPAREAVTETMSPLECVSLLGRVPVGRVGVSIGALPVVLPVNFALFDRSVVFRTVPGTKLDAAVAGAVVAFEADGYDRTGGAGWSVLVQGVASEVTDTAELSALRALPLEAWGVDGDADRFVRVAMTLISGRRFRRGPTGQLRAHAG